VAGQGRRPTHTKKEIESDCKLRSRERGGGEVTVTIGGQREMGGKRSGAERVKDELAKKNNLQTR